MVTSTNTMQYGYLDTSKADGVGHIATLDAFLSRHHASVTATRAYLDNRTREFHIRTYFRCTSEQMEAIRDSYREDMCGFSVYLEHIERPIAKSPHVISLLATDRIGIELVLSRFLAELGLSIYWHEASEFYFPQFGTPHYVIASWIDIPKLYNKEELATALNALAKANDWADIHLMTDEEYRRTSMNHTTNRMSHHMNYLDN